MLTGKLSQKAYLTLLNSLEPLSAEEIAKQLKTYPNAVYRLVTPLIQTGLIEKTNEYPSRFKTKPSKDGLSLFLLNQNKWFLDRFVAKNNPETIPNFSFIQGRDELMRLSAEEINRTEKSIDLLRSGHEIPAETMLALVRAKARGIVTRMLIQDHTPQIARQVRYWRQNGILVKKTELRQIRLMLYDAKIIYFMSYKHIESQLDTGMKIEFPPFAVILSQLFNQWWKEGQKITFP
jgi:sugar-specific transcriptional regulator TrmB